MSYPSVPNTFSNGIGNTIDATALNQNFVALVSAFSDGNSDLSMKDGTFSGTLSVAGDAVISRNLQVDGTMAVGIDTPLARLHVVGDAIITGDITDGTGWVDYSATSTVTGWSSTSTKAIKYRKVGKRIYIGFNIVGTGDNAVSSLTLPFAKNTDIIPYGPFQAIDNGDVNPAPGMWYIGANASLLVLDYKWDETSWTASGDRTVRGWAIYEAA